MPMVSALCLIAVSVFFNVFVQIETVDEYEHSFCINSSSTLQVSYGSYAPKCNEYIHPFQKVGSEPKVRWKNANHEKLYAILLVDPDAPSSYNPTNRYRLHWTLWNVNGSTLTDSSVKDNGGNDMDFYESPNLRPDGVRNDAIHRYQFFIFQQERWQVVSVRRIQRVGFDVKLFMDSQNFTRASIKATFQFRTSNQYVVQCTVPDVTNSPLVTDPLGYPTVSRMEDVVFSCKEGFQLGNGKMSSITSSCSSSGKLSPSAPSCNPKPSTAALQTSMATGTTPASHTSNMAATVQSVVTAASPQTSAANTRSATQASQMSATSTAATGQVVKSSTSTPASHTSTTTTVQSTVTNASPQTSAPETRSATQASQRSTTFTAATGQVVTGKTSRAESTEAKTGIVSTTSAKAGSGKPKIPDGGEGSTVMLSSPTLCLTTVTFVFAIFPYLRY